MFLILNRDWKAIDAGKIFNTGATVPKGRHEVELVPNPFGYTDAPWLVLCGTKIGATEGYWRQWSKEGRHISKDPAWEVEIEE